MGPRDPKEEPTSTHCTQHPMPSLAHSVQEVLVFAFELLQEMFTFLK